MNNNNQFTQEQYQMHTDQLDSIKKEIEAQDVYIITQPLDLTLLESEYYENEGFRQKISVLVYILKSIRAKFPQFRRVRRDGSCFYRAVLFKVFEHIITTKNEILAQKFTQTIENAKNDLTSIGYDKIVIDDFAEPLLTKLKLCPHNLTVEQVVETFCDKMVSDYLIMYMRMMTSGYVKTNSFMFEGYIEADSVDQFVQQEIDPIDREADQIQIIALINYINIPIRIYYLDGNIATKEPTIFQIPEDAAPETIFINLLYRPGHYDILY